MIFTLNGPNMPTEQYVKGAASSNLPLGKSAIIWTSIFPLGLQQVTHLNRTDSVKELALTIQKPVSYLIQCDASTTMCCFEMTPFNN